MKHKWPNIPLEEIVASHNSSTNPKKFPDENFELYSIPAYGVRKPEIITGNNIGSSKKNVQPNDVLLSRIVPHIQRVWVVGQKTGCRQIASGEWIIYRSDRYYPPFLRYTLLTKHFHAQFMQTISGVGGSLLRARPEQVAQIEIPLPPLKEQKRIAAILDKANAIRRKREKAIELADEFLRSVFLDMFGDPMFNPKKFHLIQLDSLFSIGKPGSKCGPFGSALKKHEYVNSGIPVWTMDNIQRSGFDKKGCLFITKEKYNELKAYEVEEGDIIISRAGTVGKMCVVPNLFSSSIISTNLIRLSLNAHKVKPEFFTYLMSNFKGRVGRLATGKDGSYTYMNTGILKELKIPLPPIELQTKFLALHDKISVVKQKHVDFYNDTLFNSLSQRAFRGDL